MAGMMEMRGIRMRMMEIKGIRVRMPEIMVEMRRTGGGV